MCWKQEWASAVNNLTRAMVRINRAKKKLEKRAEERQATITRATEKGRTDIVKDAEEKLYKITVGISNCNTILERTKLNRRALLILINEYGLSRSEDPAKTRQLMGKCTLCETKSEWSKQSCCEDPYCKMQGVT